MRRWLRWFLVGSLLAAPAAGQDASAVRASADAQGAPSVHAVITAALQHAGGDPAAVGRAIRRARRSAWLPELRLRARRGRERDQSALSSGATNLSTDDDTVLEAALVFRLDRALYANDEVAWSRERRALRNARLTLVRLVVSVYFERRRLLIEQALDEPDPEVALRILELEATLDYLTAGAFRGRWTGAP